MANDAELVIKLPKELKESLDNVREEAALDYIQVHNATFYHALKNANVLPERHGRIIDESKITSVSYHVASIQMINDVSRDFCIIDGTDAPTIIEADREE